nr:hypothetical protein 19 [Balneolaceae bacterium]
MKFFLPVVIEQTESVAGSSTETLTVDLDAEGLQAMLLKSIDLTAGPNTTITKVEVDGVDIVDTASSIDFETSFGKMILARKTIVVTLQNADASAEDTDITIRGVKEA